MLKIEETGIVEIETQNFQGLEDLQILLQMNNQLSFIPLNVFIKLTKSEMDTLGIKSIRRIAK